MSFADDYRSEVRSSIVNNLSTMAEDEGVTPTEQWCDNRRDDILPVVTGDDNGSWTCNTATSTETLMASCFPLIGMDSSTVITLMTRRWMMRRVLRFAIESIFSMKSSRQLWPSSCADSSPWPSGVSLSITPVLALSGAINPFYTIEVF